MPEFSIARDRYEGLPAFVLVEAVNNAVQDIVRRSFDASGLEWRDFVFGASDQLIDGAAIATVEERIIDSGYRFAWSSNFSLRDRPDIYADAGFQGADDEFSFEHPEAPEPVADGDGRELRGAGDNVVQRPGNVVGKAFYIRTSEQVLQLMREGVPQDTIAVIDDSGGTLTAPILEKMRGVVCAGGTVRSHLGILTREYNIPCVMNARLSGIRNGDRIEIETSATAPSVEAYRTGNLSQARIWRLA